MAHRIEWIEEPWILRVTYTDNQMTAQDIETIMKFCVAAVEKHPANFLVDVTTVNFHEASLFRSKALLTLFRHRNTRWFAFVGLTGLLHAAAQALMMRTAFKSFTNEQEAIAFLRQKAEQQKAAEQQAEAAKLLAQEKSAAPF